MKKNSFVDLDEKRKERRKSVSIICEETGERFEIEKKTAIPILEALRIRAKMKENPINTDSDISETAKILSVLSEIH